MTSTYVAAEGGGSGGVFLLWSIVALIIVVGGGLFTYSIVINARDKRRPARRRREREPVDDDRRLPARQMPLPMGPMVGGQPVRGMGPGPGYGEQHHDYPGSRPPLALPSSGRPIELPSGPVVGSGYGDVASIYGAPGRPVSSMPASSMPASGTPYASQYSAEPRADEWRDDHDRHSAQRHTTDRRESEPYGSGRRDADRYDADRYDTDRRDADRYGADPDRHSSRRAEGQRRDSDRYEDRYDDRYGPDPRGRSRADERERERDRYGSDDRDRHGSDDRYGGRRDPDARSERGGRHGRRTDDPDALYDPLPGHDAERRRPDPRTDSRYEDPRSDPRHGRDRRGEPEPRRDPPSRYEALVGPALYDPPISKPRPATPATGSAVEPPTTPSTPTAPKPTLGTPSQTAAPTPTAMPRPTLGTPAPEPTPPRPTLGTPTTWPPSTVDDADSAAPAAPTGGPIHVGPATVGPAVSGPEDQTRRVPAYPSPARSGSGLTEATAMFSTTTPAPEPVVAMPPPVTAPAPPARTPQCASAWAEADLYEDRAKAAHAAAAPAIEAAQAAEAEHTAAVQRATDARTAHEAIIQEAATVAAEISRLEKAGPQVVNEAVQQQTSHAAYEAFKRGDITADQLREVFKRAEGWTPEHDRLTQRRNDLRTDEATTAKARIAAERAVPAAAELARNARATANTLEKAARDADTAALMRRTAAQECEQRNRR